MKHFLIALVVLCNSMVTSATEVWPSGDKVIEIIVPHPAGGGGDKWGRVVNEIFRSQGWKSIVVNKPGADTVIGANHVASARPDGYTLFIGGTSFITNLAFQKRVSGIEYTEASFAPIISLGAGTAVLAVNKDLPINNYQEFKQYVKANPDKFNLGFWHSHTSNIFYEWAQKEGLPRPNIVIYKGSAPQIVDLLGGHVPFAFDVFANLAQHYQSGKVKIVAVLDSRGMEIIRKTNAQANVVSLAHIHNSLDMPIWYGLYAPANTPPDIITKINQVINRALKDPKYSQDLSSLHVANYGGTILEQQQIQTRFLNNMRRLAAAAEK